MLDKLIVKGAREHNLKNINLELPRDKLIVITGLSGSGKSTLAFDTIYAEGQRRYVESLSAYARQFLGLMNKPDVDSIEGLSPAISIQQKTTSKNPRSTVGTVTEIYDYLRLLFARIGIPHCPVCKKEIKAQSAQQIVKRIQEKYKDEQVIILSPIVRQKKGTYEKVIEDLHKEGFVRVRVNKQIQRTNEKVNLDRYKKHDIEIVVDRLSASDSTRLAEAVELSLKRGEGFTIVLNAKDEEELFSSHYACPDHDINFEDIQPRIFSFNSPFGACQTCHGLGIKQEFDPDLVIPDTSLSIFEGALAPYNTYKDGWRHQTVAGIAKHFGFDLHTPINQLKQKHVDILLFGTDETIKYNYQSKDREANYAFSSRWEGVIPQLARLYAQTESDYRREELEKFMKTLSCPECKGKRLQEKVLSITIQNKNIIDVTDMSIEDSYAFFQNLNLTEKELFIAKQVLKEIRERLGFLSNVGLDYLTLSRSAGTLSGGEAQRIRLATQIGSNLMGVLYILDEPSIGLHQRDNHKLIETLKHLRDLGNTLIVVEHDEDTMKAADYIVDIGPGAGVHGGHVVAQGTPKEVMNNKKSLTGQYLCGINHIPVPKKRRRSTQSIKLKGCTNNNLKNIDVEFPMNTLTLVTGVSGSGKSTLMNETLFPALKSKLSKSLSIPQGLKSITIDEDINSIIVIDQDPIGKTPRSNPATYTKVFDDIRKIFSMTKDAKVRGYQQGRFSFNVKGGRCETCQGDGQIKIEMNFLPDVYVECEECKGKRYNKETLEVKYKDKTIADVLNMTIEEAFTFFENIPSIKRKLETLNDVGLSYIKLGQSSTTLSGGEAQRIKLSRELSKRGIGHTVYILDEPTTGLHFEDVKRLVDVLQRLVEKKNTVIVIEHNLDVIKTADHIIDIGPEGGNKGGEIVAHGTPEEVVKVKKSHTGVYLKPLLEVKR